MIGLGRILRTRWLFLGLVFVSNGICPHVISGQEPAAETIDFEKQIRPILEAKCFLCHGPTVRSGGLRLDNREEVLVGGYSQKPLVGGTLETNEIYLRVSSKNPAYRMPKSSDSLTDTEISRIKQWVVEGAIWPEPKDVRDDVEQPGWFDHQAWLDYAERWVKDVPGVIPWLVGMLGCMLFLWFVERYKQAVHKGKAWTISLRGRWLAPLRQFGFVHFLLLMSVMGWILTLLVWKAQRIQIRILNEQLKFDQGPRQPALTAFAINSVYGVPPVPLHPGHPARLRGEYYRGNCERNPKLFNGGNYRTATLRISLIDANGRDVNYGDTIEPNSLSIRFELERPRGTTPMLYSESIIKGVFLTPQLIPERPTKLDQPVIRLTETKPGWNWEAIVPLKGPSDIATMSLSGLVYVYQGSIDGDKGRGSLHYGIKYDLNLKELILQPDSQVWLGSLFWTPTLEHPTLGKVPLKEWFDDKPIPEMTGENSTDPKLLGIPEHEAKFKVGN